MQKACEAQPSTMAAILGLEDELVEDICRQIEDTVVPANYNCPGQLVISGTKQAIAEACHKLSEAGARRVLPLPVGGAFHSPLMEPARIELETAINNTPFKEGLCSCVSKCNCKSSKQSRGNKRKPNKATNGLLVRWTQSMQQMISDGATSVTEVGPEKVLQGLFKKVDRTFSTESASL